MQNSGRRWSSPNWSIGAKLDLSKPLKCSAGADNIVALLTNLEEELWSLHRVLTIVLGYV